MPRLPLAAAATSERLRRNYLTLLATPEFNRLLEDITTCTMALEPEPRWGERQELKGGIELFPYLAVQTKRHHLQISGTLYPNQEDKEQGTLYHLIHLQVGPASYLYKLTTIQSSFLLSPFHCRFVSILFGLAWFYVLAVETGAVQQDFLTFAPYSLEEQVVARYLQSLVWIPCATIRLDAEDNPYIASRLYTPADLRRCQIPGSSAETAIIRGWRLFKRLLYYSIEGEQIYSGFVYLPGHRSLEEYKRIYPYLALYHEADWVPLDEGVEAIKQLLLNADGRQTFLTVYRNLIVGVLHLAEGTQRQLTTSKSWRDLLTLATVGRRGRFSFWLALKGRRSPVIPLSLLEYRQGRIRIPLFQDVFWQDLERYLQRFVSDGELTAALEEIKKLLRSMRLSARGGILLFGMESSKLQEPFVPIENEIRLAQPIPLQPPWHHILLGLAKSDGAVLFNDKLAATHFRARLKATGLQLPRLRGDELGSGTRHQATREFTAYYPEVVGLCISTDGPVSLYYRGRLSSRLY